MANVFLSYDHEDVALARPIAAALEKAGHIVWYDRHIHGGAQYSRKIEQALDASDAVIVLWSPRSLESAWVRDEAAEGRDRGKLVPLSVGGVTAPMGFRQFQTIDLGSWSGRGKVPHLNELLDGIASQAEESGQVPIPSTHGTIPLPARATGRSRWIAMGLALVLLAAIGIGAWKWLGRGALPVVEVAAANNAPRSQAGASDLFVKLGSLAQVGEGKWQLVDAASAPAKPTFIFRTADTGSASKPQANLVLLDGTDDSLLWSREFTFPAGGDADLRQQLSLTAGRVLGCALESRDAGGLHRDLLKLFLNACAMTAETSFDDPESIVRPLRAVVASAPKFKPAWGRLLYADMNVLDIADYTAADPSSARKILDDDIRQAERIYPDLPEFTLAKIRFLPKADYQQALDLLAKAIEKSPENSQLLAEQAAALQRVGRMYESALSAQRAAAADPLSPGLTRERIMTLAYSGQIEDARNELARAERLWAGTGALRDAMWAFHLRFGDPAVARRYANFQSEGLDIYLNARADPSAANVERLATFERQFETRPGADWGWAVQALGEFNRNDDVFRWLSHIPIDDASTHSYLLFRPALVNLRKDPRFMAVAERIGLVNYWRKSGKWPDYCNDPKLPYDCKAEAAKYAA